MKILKDIIASDWSEAKVLLGVTPIDTIEVVFMLYRFLWIIAEEVCVANSASLQHT